MYCILYGLVSVVNCWRVTCWVYKLQVCSVEERLMPLRLLGSNAVIMITNFWMYVRLSNLISFSHGHYTVCYVMGFTQYSRCGGTVPMRHLGMDTICYRFYAHWVYLLIFLCFRICNEWAFYFDARVPIARCGVISTIEFWPTNRMHVWMHVWINDAGLVRNS